MKILAIASAGGHWVQLLRLMPSFTGHDLVFASTKKGFESMVEGMPFQLILDSNRTNIGGLIKTFCQTFKLIKREKPHVIITTGAAPGLMAIIIGKVLGKKTIWIDSIANVEQLSLSGKIVNRFADRVYTQWPDLANEKVFYKGNVIG